MAKTRTEPTPEPPPEPKPASPSPYAKLMFWRRSKRPKPKGDGTRETIESIVVAFLAAFLFRTFEAEAFVIPTGSMAPTLMGRHKDVECPECGTHFPVGASDEVRFAVARGDRSQLTDGAVLNPQNRLQTAFCPNCRVEIDVRDLPVFTGDRILVNKWPYEMANPRRWDVVVFKYPEEPKTNYIKRLVGLPGEELSILRGDVFARGEDNVSQILRKPPGKQRELRIPVYDDTHPPRQLLDAGWPERWQGVRADAESHSGWKAADDGWQSDGDDRSYAVEAGDDPTWLRYRHFVPTPSDWAALPAVSNPRARLVTDFLAYNTYTGGARSGFEAEPIVDDDHWSGFWVGDLAIDARVSVDKAEGELVLELNEGTRSYRCTIDLATGEAVLSHLEEDLDREAPVEVKIATAKTRMRSTGRYRVEFSNFDRRLDLWINGALVTFDSDTTYDPPQIPGPALGDLSPVGIAARNTSVEVSRLRIFRDVYYRAEDAGSFGGHPLTEATPDELEKLAQLDDDPIEWWNFYNREGRSRTVTFDRLADDEFFMMGDNSARSQDSRLWPNGEISDLRRERRHAVPRSALVGKAFFIYWPHGVPFLNDGKGYSGWARHIPGVNLFFYHREVAQNGRLVFSDYPLRGVPFYPNIGRMERIR